MKSSITKKLTAALIGIMTAFCICIPAFAGTITIDPSGAAQMNMPATVSPARPKRPDSMNGLMSILQDPNQTKETQEAPAAPKGPDRMDQFMKNILNPDRTSNSSDELVHAGNGNENIHGIVEVPVDLSHIGTGNENVHGIVEVPLDISNIGEGNNNIHGNPNVNVRDNVLNINLLTLQVSDRK